MQVRVATSQSLTVLSGPPLASTAPSGLNATQNTGPRSPVRVAVHVRVPTSHSRMVPSTLALASSGAVRAERHLAHDLAVAGEDGDARAARSHKRTVWSPLPVASMPPSGANANECTHPPWPLRVATQVRVATSHSRTVL